jgi:putative restriction endonuclease
LVSLYLGITDRDWFDFLQSLPELEECNFWQPSGNVRFQALQPGELFLFKLHSPDNFVVGGGIFAHATTLPVSLAWEAFGRTNGAPSLPQMRDRIAKYRRESADPRADYQIGCRILEQPFFFRRDEWIRVPESWKPQTQVGKTYRTDGTEGLALWQAVQDRLMVSRPAGLAEESARYGEPVLIKPRLGQGTFRIAVTDAYQRRCSFTGERVLPALEAAHIRPYAEGGGHEVANGLLLRRDIHTLFDLGYITIAPDLRVNVSRRLKLDFDNGRAYYALHGQPIRSPAVAHQQPARESIEWHNERFLG